MLNPEEHQQLDSNHPIVQCEALVENESAQTPEGTDSPVDEILQVGRIGDLEAIGEASTTSVRSECPSFGTHEVMLIKWSPHAPPPLPSRSTHAQPPSPLPSPRLLPYPTRATPPTRSHPTPAPDPSTPTPALTPSPQPFPLPHSTPPLPAAPPPRCHRRPCATELPLPHLQLLRVRARAREGKLPKPYAPTPDPHTPRVQFIERKKFTKKDQKRPKKFNMNNNKNSQIRKTLKIWQDKKRQIIHQ
ncbi:hypothetical protein BSKO_04013 [Bryopsis sp. KO-2023]|nr:hypothetical protein BSKO_04013 [Bryopsis sp. KO-2023]